MGVVFLHPHELEFKIRNLSDAKLWAAMLILIELKNCFGSISEG